MAEVLCVYREVKILKESAAQSKTEPSDAVAIVSYDEKPGIQAIATTAPDLPSKPGRYATLARDHELKASRHGQLAGRHRSSHRSGPRSRQGPPPSSREFIEFLKLLDAAYPSHTAIKLILDNHSAHISKETKAWLAEQPTGRFEFTFTPKHGYRGRDGHCWPPPAQIRACPIQALGSYLECMTRNRLSGQG